jgi:hypothetical protein
VGAEAAAVHVPEVDRGLSAEIHSAITLPTPPAAASPCAQNPAATKNPRTSVSPRQNSAVGGERLRAVDQPRDADVLHRRDRMRELTTISSKRLPVLLEQPAVEVGCDRIQPWPPPVSAHGALARS